MISTWAKGIQWITWIRLWAALLLAILALDWVTALGDDVMGFSLLIPFTYMYAFDATSTANISVLLIPMLVNIALWVPCMQSYLFLRVVLYAEYIKYIVVLPFLIMVLPFGVFFQRNNPVKTFLAVTILLVITWKLSSELKKEQYMVYFKVNTTNKLEFDQALVKMGIVFLLTVLTANAMEYYLNKGVYNSNSVKYDTMSFNSINPLVNQVKISKDENFFLMRESTSMGNETKFRIYDIKTMKNVLIMPILAEQGSITTFTGYTLTNDNKYIIVGDKLSSKAEVGFQLYSTETHQLDNRFSNSNKISKLNSSQAAKVIDKIEFNKLGNYFALTEQVSNIVEVWDYIKGELVYTEEYPNTINCFLWLSDSEFLVAYYSESNRNIVNIIKYDLSENRNVTKTAKTEIAHSLSTQPDYTWTMKSSYDGKYIATSGYKESKTDRLYTVNIWDVKNQRKISTVSRQTKLLDVAFHPDNKRFVVLDVLSGKPSRIIIWNIETGDKEKELLVLDINNSKKIAIHMLDNGRKLMIVNEAIHFLSLE